MIIDKYMNKYDYRKYHEINVACNIENAYKAIVQADISRSLVIKILFALRGLNKNFTSLQELERIGFIKLGEVVNKKMVYGTLTNSPGFSVCIPKFTPVEFLNQTTGIKAAINFSVHYINSNTTGISTETRILCISKKLKNRFSIYWFFIAPFSSLIRYQLLAQIKKTVNKK